MNKYSSYQPVLISYCSDVELIDVPVPKDWHGETHFRSEGWGPLWCWGSFEDWINDVFLNPCEDVNADLIKWVPNDFHDHVPNHKDVHWDDPKSIDDPFDDWPDDVIEEFIEHPDDLPEVVINPHEEAENDEE